MLSYVSTGGREIEIRDLNDVRLLRGTNETASAGVSVNDGKWHQVGVPINNTLSLPFPVT